MLSELANAAPLIVVLIGVFAALFIGGLSRASSGGDLDWQLARIERKLDLILTNMGISHDQHIPKSVVGLAQAGHKIEAIKEYRRLTGANLVVAKREIEYLMSRPAPGQDTAATEL
jgi:hypothetical protein